MSEGFAEFAGGQLNPTAERVSFRVYIGTPHDPLFTRSYNAQGFFFHLDTVGGDVFGRFETAFKLKDSSAAFAYLIEPIGDGFDDTWASALALDPLRGDAWHMPEAPADALPRVPEGVLANGMQMLANPGEATTRIAHIDFEADVVRFEVTGGMHGRISWDNAGEAVMSTLAGSVFCRKAGGCECPAGSTGSGPQTELPSPSAMISVAGTTKPTTVAITGESLADYCLRAPTTTTTVIAAVDPCVVGTWESEEWTLPGPAGLAARGGAGAIVRIVPTGAAEWQFDGMQPVTKFDEQIDVTTDLYSKGSATAQVIATGGTWEVSDADISETEGLSVDNIIGEIRLVGGPGLFLLLQDGAYTCSGDLLSYNTIDPVEKVTINIPMRRRSGTNQ